MFAKFLQKDHPDLARSADELEINLDNLESLYQMSPTTALNTLRELIKSRVPKDVPARIDRVEEFQTRYKDIISAALEARDQIEDAVAEFIKDRGVRVIIDWNAPNNKPFVRLGRAPRGSKMVPKRDLARLYKYLRRKGIPTTIRVAPSEEDPYEHAEILPNGKIKAGNETFPDLSAWVNGSVYRRAKERGSRSVSIGSPYKGAKIQNARGDWITLDRAWKNMLDDEKGHTNGVAKPRGRPRKQ